MKNKTKLSAFTLIELLIVIAIIGILAGLMAGGISIAMDAAKATTIGNNGRNIVQAIVQSNNDRLANAQSELWPVKAKWTGKTSNEYFNRLMDKGLIEGIAVADFAGGGVSAAKTVADLKDGGCVWNVLAGVGDLDSYAPFIWTRNLDALTTDDFKESDDTALELDATVTPFQDKRVVLVRRGGAMVNLKKSLLTHQSFLGGSSNTVDNLEILATKDKTDNGGGSTGSNWDD